VSLYDHMYTRGYVQPTQDSDNIGMCGCIEDMPKVSRADCTEIEASATFSVSFSDLLKFQVTADNDLDVEFNACQGTNPSNGNAANNDLASYINRLHINGEIDGNAKDKAFETLVGYAQPGNNNNEAACRDAYEERFGPYPDEVEDKRCSPDTAVFVIDEADFTSLEECQAACQNTPGCSYFSLGVDTGNDDYDQKGVCYGCQANIDNEDGFNTWELTEKTPDPTCQIGLLPASGKFCCPESCGSCGGPGCSQRPGGASACCVTNIETSGVSCDESNAPCIVSNPEPQMDPTCENGLLSDNGEFCCKDSCGSCGGPGCSQRPGGAAGCCVGHIENSQVSCDDSIAPCIVSNPEPPNEPETGDPTCENGVLTPNGKFCCKDTCGSCGGSGCSQRPGGVAGCCVGHISRSGNTCDASVAPCIM